MGFRNIVRRIIDPRPNSYCLELSCLKHQVQLSCKLALSISDVLCKRFGLPFTYFSSLAKWIHLWRDSQNGDKAFAWSCDRYGHELALAHMRRKPPRCLSGRWGSVDDVERFLLSAPFEDNHKGFATNMATQAFLALLANTDAVARWL